MAVNLGDPAQELHNSCSAHSITPLYLMLQFHLDHLPPFTCPPSNTELWEACLWSCLCG